MSKNARLLIPVGLATFGVGLIAGYLVQPPRVGEPQERQATPAYVIADITLHDAERYQEYLANVPALIEKHGGVFRARGGNTQVLEGDWSPSRLIILEFPDREAAIALYNDPAYEPYKRLRRAVSDGNLVLVDGV